MALAVNPQALTERLLALFNDTTSNSDASISQSRRAPLSDSTISSTEVEPDTFFHRSLFDVEDCEGGLDAMKDVQTVVDNHFPEWTKSMSDLFLRKRENERKAALLKVEEYRDSQPVTGNLFEEQISRSESPRDGQIPGGWGRKFDTVGDTEKCYEDIPTSCKEEISERSSGKLGTTRRVGSTRRSSKGDRRLSQSRSRRQPQTQSAKKNTLSKTALSQAPNSVLNGRVQKPRQSSSSASAKPKVDPTASPPRRSARIQAMKEKAELSKPTTTSPSRGQRRSTGRPQKRQPFRHSRPQSKPQGISKPKTRNTRNTRNSRG